MTASPFESMPFGHRPPIFPAPRRSGAFRTTGEATLPLQPAATRAVLRHAFEETLERSALPVVVGAKPFSQAQLFATEDGALHLVRGGAHLRLESTPDRRVIRGTSTSRGCEVEGRYLRTDHGEWREVQTRVTEYGHRSLLDAREHPIRRLTSQRLEDGSVVTSTLEWIRCPELDEEVLRRSRSITRRDRSRVEELDSVLRVGEQARFDSTRTEFDARYRKRKSLEYHYPWLPASFYARVRTELEREPPDFW